MLFDFYDAKLIKNVTSYLKYLMKYNAGSIGVCYEGGLDECGRPADTRRGGEITLYVNYERVKCGSNAYE